MKWGRLLGASGPRGAGAPVSALIALLVSLIAAQEAGARSEAGQGGDSPSELASTGPMRLAVVVVQSVDVGGDLARTIGEALEGEVVASGRFTLVSGQEVRSLLGGARQQDVVDCTDEACLVEVGGALGVDALLAVHVGQIGATYAVHLRLVPVAAEVGGASRRVSETVRGDLTALLTTLRGSARRILSAPGVNPWPAAVRPHDSEGVPTAWLAGTNTALVGMWGGLGAGALAGGSYFGYRMVRLRQQGQAPEETGSQVRLRDAARARTAALVLVGVAAAALCGAVMTQGHDAQAQQTPSASLDGPGARFAPPRQTAALWVGQSRFQSALTISF